MDGPIKTVFLDRDGVINRRLPDDYVKRWDEFEFLPGVPEALSRLRHAGLFTVVVSNQRGIARGLMTADDVEGVHLRMQAELQASGAAVNAIYYCPDMSGPMRKPEPGMLLAAARDHPEVDLARSVIIGDSISDLMAGAAAGTRCVLVAGANEREQKLEEARDAGITVDACVATLLEAVSTPPLSDAVAHATSREHSR